MLNQNILNLKLQFVKKNIAFLFQMKIMNILSENGGLTFDWRPVIREVLSDVKNGVPAGTVSVRFHRAVINLVASAAVAIKNETGCAKVALSGGVFQNEYLLENCVTALQNKYFTVYTNELIPVNDGGISFGQAAAASYQFRANENTHACFG